MKMTGNMSGTVVIITGASSGIGRATAQQFAQRGATVVLAARRRQLLDQVREECLALGGAALVVPTDMANHAQVEALEKRAVEEFGRVDVWVNNAGALALGRVDEIPVSDHEQLIRTSLLGYIYGTCAAICRFRQQGHGTLINNISVLATIAAPFASSYCATKSGVRAFTESVRMELLDQPNINVCAVLPAAIDTPIYKNAANYMGYKARAPEPVYAANQVAKAIVGLAELPRRELYVGKIGQLGAVVQHLLPALAEPATRAFIDRLQFETQPAAQTQGNLYEPSSDDGCISGGRRPSVWKRLKRPSKLVLFALPTLIHYLRRQR
jgi:short-subunit dehydrogenase